MGRSVRPGADRVATGKTDDPFARRQVKDIGVEGGDQNVGFDNAFKRSAKFPHKIVFQACPSLKPSFFFPSMMLRIAIKYRFR
jgi:hypothetical protein